VEGPGRKKRKASKGLLVYFSIVEFLKGKDPPVNFKKQTEAAEDRGYRVLLCWKKELYNFPRRSISASSISSLLLHAR